MARAAIVLAPSTVKFFWLRSAQAGAVLPNRDEGTIRGTPYGVRNVAVARVSSALASPF
jgi:hypothetical protein